MIVSDEKENKKDQEKKNKKMKKSIYNVTRELCKG